MNNACEEKQIQILTITSKFLDSFHFGLILSLLASQICKTHFDKTYPKLRSFTIHKGLTQYSGMFQYR
jgi:hypothetical protein